MSKLRGKKKYSIKRAGSQLALSGIIVFFGIQVAEMNYIGSYSINRNYISELGVNDSSASFIFNFSMIVAGILIMSSARKFMRNSYSNLFTTSLWIYGLGTFGVGLFNDKNIGVLHGIFAGLLFLTGPIAALASRKYAQSNIKQFSLVLAIISTFFLLALITSQDPNSVGGVERLAVYPITMWLIVYGSHISVKNNPTESMN